MDNLLITVVETSEFLKKTQKLMDDHNADMPLFALTAYAKNERADLSAANRNDFKRLTKILVETYGRKRHE